MRFYISVILLFNGEARVPDAWFPPLFGLNFFCCTTLLLICCYVNLFFNRNMFLFKNRLTELFFC